MDVYKVDFRPALVETRTLYVGSSIIFQYRRGRVNQDGTKELGDWVTTGTLIYEPCEPTLWERLLYMFS